jgi:YD repeat-containing protein
MVNRDLAKAGGLRGLVGGQRGTPLVVFALLLLACSAVPVFAAEAPPSDEAGVATAEQEDPVVPDGEDVREGLEATERRDAERREWLQSPEAVRQREESRHAYAGISTSEAKELLSSVFDAEFAKLDSDPARLLSDVQLVGPVTDESVVAIREDEETDLLDAGMPVQTEDDEGQVSKIDLSLEATPEGFEPSNPLVEELVIPNTAGEPVEIGDEGLAISAVGVAEDRGAHRLGDEDIYFNAVLPDTGYLVAPIAGGVELFNVLYSEGSPETLHYNLDLPAGAHLRADGRGGARVVKDDEEIAYIPFPTAVDAQGTRVPVEMKIEGDQIDLHVSHRGADYAMPILVDPAIHESFEGGWYWGDQNALKSLDPFPGVWNYSTNDPDQAWFVRGTHCLTGDLCSPSGRGLFMFTYPKNFPANVWGHFWYWAPGATTYIPSIYPEPSAAINPFWRNNHGCSQEQYPRPYDYNGSFDANGNWLWHETNRAQWYGYATMFTKAKGIAFGMSTGNGGWVPCYRSIMGGGYAVRLEDEDAPVMYGATVPPGWVGDSSNFTVTANAGDGSLGVHRIRITPDGRNLFEHSLGCAGTAVNRCPNFKNESISVSADRFNEGERPVHFAALDPTGEPVSNSLPRTIRVDTTPPKITLKGQLAKETKEVGTEEKPAGTGDELSLPVYNLVIEAEDFAPGAQGKDKRSGVKNIEILLDGVKQEVPWGAQSCTVDGCPATMVKSYPAPLGTLQTSGPHKLEVIAVDQVGEPLKRTIEFEYFPATGMKDEYVMHYFPLSDGEGNESEEEHPDRPELAVNVANGNLVYRETDVDVESSAGLDLEVERYYNSLLPESENTEVGDGWTLGQAPELDPDPAEGSNPPAEATMLRSSAAYEEDVELPAGAGESEFDPELQALVTKQADGDIKLTDETGESAAETVFDQGGHVEEQLGPGYAKAVYDYEGGELAGIDIVDPATFAAEAPEPKNEEPPAPTFASTFGANGSGNGQMKLPADVAVSPGGSIWVVDKGNNRIQRFNANGSFFSAFGSLGSGNGQFNSPAAIAIGPQGHIYVADKGNSRVQKFNSFGLYLGQFGSMGTGNGQFAGAGPEGIAVDPKGNVWVADTYGGRLQVFSESGAFIKSVSSPGSAPGQLSKPTGIDIDPDGTVWVADWAVNRISVFNEAGGFLRQFGSYGTGEGQFANPAEVNVDGEGNVWVADRWNQRIQQFDEAGNFVAKFGSFGIAQGQFSFSSPLGIATDAKGSLWVADVNNHRIQRFQIPRPEPAYHSSFGGAGFWAGKLYQPADVAFDRRGYLWVADEGNDRLQRFDPSGEYVSKFGSPGSEDGQLDKPAALALDADGYLWVADKMNNRIQKFNEDGQFLGSFGVEGEGPGQLQRPEGIAIDANGDIWVADTHNLRIQKFDDQGEFLEVVNPPGMGAIEPTGIDAGPGGTIWVTDWQNNRVVVLNETGGLVRQFGSAGSGPGQFARPDAIEVDAKGRVWVGDQNNSRIQQFNRHGEYVAHFGAAGSGPGQFSFSPPFGIASAGNRLWVVDRDNHRVQRWEPPLQVPPVVPVGDDDPSIEVETEGGLLTSVEGDEAGEHVYDHEGDLLTSHEDTDGESLYEYDEAGRMTRVEPPSGAWAEIEYGSTDGRVKKVTVDPAGAEPEKTTQFEYTDAFGPEEARSTRVVIEGAPDVTYDIGGDGSVVKWWHVPQPPKFLDISGSLWAEKESKIAVGDHFLKVVADSPEGIASIQIIVNGDTVVSEKTCQQTEEFGTECTQEEDEWVVGTAEMAPGILNLEAIVTDEDGQSETERFWVEIPFTPPPAEGEPAPPRFRDVLRFREEYGLEVIFPVANESELNERILNLIGAWHNPNTPAGEVARASWERWGVPLRLEDVAELEYRDRYLAQAASSVPAWAASNAPATYAGFYMDHRNGGIVRVGFTAEQASKIAQLKANGGLMAPERIAAFPYEPSRTLATLEGSLSTASQIVTDPPAPPGIVSVSLDIPGNRLRLGTTEVATTEAFAAEAFGSEAGVVVSAEAPSQEFAGRYKAGIPFLAATYIRNYETQCMAGFGAWRKYGKKPNGEPYKRRYVLTAGHCFPKTFSNAISVIHRPRFEGDLGEEIGKVELQGFLEDPNRIDTDAEAIWLSKTDLIPSWIYECCGGRASMKVTGVTFPQQGDTVCQSSQFLNRVTCGPVTKVGDFDRLVVDEKTGRLSGWHWMIRAAVGGGKGDSGGPVWMRETGEAVGLVAGGGEGGLAITPFKRPPNATAVQIAGIFSDPHLHVQVGK